MRPSRRLLSPVTAALVAAALTMLCAVGDAVAARPNIVLIMCDDMGWSDIGCYGGEVSTPNLDRLAGEGLRFTQFYNGAKCTTTRAALLTGLYPRQGKGGLLRTNMVTLGEAMRLAGYQTSLSGKWHLGSKSPRRPIDRGFNEYYGLMDGCCNFFNPVQPDPKFKGGRVRVFGHNDQLIKEFPDDFYTTDAFSDHAVTTIDRFAQSDKPFFVHVTYTAPHYPLHAKPADIAKYKGKYSAGWDALRRVRHERQIKMGLIDASWKLPERDPEATSWKDAQHKEWQALRMAVYAAMIDSMDQGIGRILAALDRNEVADNTVVMFLSDNGGCAENPGGEDPQRIPGPKEYYTTCGPGWAFAQNTPFRRYKTWMHEGGIATPFIVHWPGKTPAGTLTGQVGHIIDLMPTLLDLGEGEYPETYEGNSILPVEGLTLRPIFEGQKRAGHETLYWEYSGNRAVRQQQWKLAWDRKQKRWELYDMVVDRTETNDLSDTHPQRAKQMADRWFAWAEKTGARTGR